MNPKFEVKFETNLQHDPYYDNYSILLLDVIPKSLSLNCPHCQVYSVMRFDSIVKRFETDNECGISVQDENLLFDFVCSCPNCNNTVFVQAQAQASTVRLHPIEVYEELEASSGGQIVSIYPYRKRVTVPPEVPEKYSGDFREAVLVIDLSPTASAALSRRILQSILRDEFGIKCSNLAKEIEDFISQSGIPSYLTDAVDAIRNIGNLAAHPLKNTNTGEIVAVEPGEAEWLIEVLNSLFDFKFIQPLKLQEKKDRLNAKLQELGKPPMK
jgi:Domain of unknown function (DUF4145)